MNNRATTMFALGLVGTCLLAGGLLWPAQDPHRESAKQIVEATGVKGGLVVHLGCGDGKLTAALRANDSYVVHGLDARASNVAKARQHIHSVGLYGAVSVDQLRGSRLPYADNLVNLLVAEDLGPVPMKEVRRVLAPDGVAYTKLGGKWVRNVKPRPQEIGEWTHFLHDATGNPVAKDVRVGPPRTMQWVAGPRWSRSHEFNSSLCALVSAQGRVFYIHDEGPIGITDDRFPERWSLIARDGFNGVLLWKRHMPRWSWREWKSKGRTSLPATLPRRLVAQGDRLYVTLGYWAPVSVLDAASGELLHTLEATAGTDEILHTDAGLILLMREPPDAPTGRGEIERGPAAVARVNPDTAEVLWNVDQDRIAPLMLAAGRDGVAFLGKDEVVCLALADGRELWRRRLEPDGDKPGQPRVLVVHEDVVLLLTRTRLMALSVEGGDVLWSSSAGQGVVGRPDLFVADGLVWGGGAGRLEGRDLRTGEVKRTIDPGSVFSRGHHPRCYRSKATERYIITPNRGAEFISLTSEAHTQNDWLRGPCRYGVMPSNGLLYVPPHPCFCYPSAMLRGFYVLGPSRESRGSSSTDASGRLERGTAYGQVGDGSSAAGQGDWPTYRHGPQRLGATTSPVPADVRRLWETRVGGRITPTVATARMVLVAAVDAHTVYALNAGDGKVLWRYTAGGRVDSPPTISHGRVLFGSADGWVYCLRARDGRLAWRFRAAPEERMIGAFGQLESAWRVHGSVLVQDGPATLRPSSGQAGSGQAVAYCTAGRSTYLDGGIYVYALDVETGRMLRGARLDGAEQAPPQAGDTPFLPAFQVEGSRSDILVSDGTHIYMGQIRLDTSLVQQPVPYVEAGPQETVGMDLTAAEFVHKPLFKGDYESLAPLGVLRGPMGDRQIGLHVFSTAGFLDDTWFNRTFWMYSETWPGYYMAHLAPKAGQLLVVDATTTYAVQAFPSRNIHSPLFTPGKAGYLLLADDNHNEPILDYRARGRDKGMGFTRAAPPKWCRWVPVRVRAMVGANKTLFVAGPPDVVDPEDPLGAFEGRKGGVLMAVRAADGAVLSERQLEAPPVFDGMIAASARLYISTEDGRVVCFGGM